MGITGLFSLLRSKTVCAEAPHVSLYGRTIAYDTSILFYQVAHSRGSEHAHVHGMWLKAIGLLRRGVLPVFIFDGKMPFQKSRQVTAQSIRFQWEADTKHLLTLMGLPYVEAPGEAEAQCAELVKSGKCWGAATEDSDAFAFGCPRLIRQLHLIRNNQLSFDFVELSSFLRGSNLTHAQLVDVCVLSGCDYAPSVRGVGPNKALALIQQHGTLEGAFAASPKLQKMDIGPFLTARRLFISPNVTPGASIEIAIKKVDEGCLRRFLTLERHFQKELVEDGLQVLKAVGRGQGTSLGLIPPQLVTPKKRTVGRSPYKSPLATPKGQSVSLTSPRTPRTTYLHTTYSATGSTRAPEELFPEEAPTPAPKAAEVVGPSVSLLSPRTPRTTYVRTAYSATGSTRAPEELFPEEEPTPAPKSAEAAHNSRNTKGNAEHSVSGRSGDSAGGSDTVCRLQGHVPREGACAKKLHFRASKLRPADTKGAAEVPRDSDSLSPNAVRKPLLWKLIARPESDQGQAADTNPPQADAKGSSVALNLSCLPRPQPLSDVFQQTTQNNPQHGRTRGFCVAEGRPNKRRKMNISVDMQHFVHHHCCSIQQALWLSRSELESLLVEHYQCSKRQAYIATAGLRRISISNVHWDRSKRKFLFSPSTASSTPNPNLALPIAVIDVSSGTDTDHASGDDLCGLYA